MPHESRFGPPTALALVIACACSSTRSANGTGERDGAESASSEGQATQVEFTVTVADDAQASAWVRLRRPDDQPGWITVRRDTASAPIFLRERCEVPPCGEPPAVCGMTLPENRELAPGDTLRFVWPLLDSELSPDGRCERRVTVPNGTYLAEACWTRTPPPPFDPRKGPSSVPDLTNVVCQVRSFDVPGSVRVTWVLDGDGEAG